MNAYERRKRIRELQQQRIKNARLEARLLQVDRIASNYEEAVKDASELSITVDHRSGWYIVRAHGDKDGKLGEQRLREKDIIVRTRQLQAAKSGIQNTTQEDV